MGMLNAETGYIRCNTVIQLDGNVTMVFFQRDFNACIYAIERENCEHARVTDKMNY